MKPFPIPVVALGPGSQPEEEPLHYVAAPGPMAVFEAPRPRPAPDPAAAREARERLEAFVANLRAGGGRARLSLTGMASAVIEQINELLGQGEVSALVSGARPARIQETAFPGIWRVLGDAGLDEVEAADVPDIVRSSLATMDAAITTPTPPADAAAGPALLAELREASARWTGGDPHVINLTLLPVTPADLDYLDAALGRGPVQLLSRGYGNCRITSTRLARTWWVQYFNSVDALILNTLEVTDVPAAAQAAPEDLQDSVERLSEWLGTAEDGQ